MGRSATVTWSETEAGHTKGLFQYFLGIPDDFIDAARIDGAGESRTWWRIIFSLTTPAMAALAVFSLPGSWNNFVWPLIIAQDSNHYTVPIGMAQLSGVMNQSTAGAVMAGAMLASLIPMFIFLRSQDQFVESVAATGVKG